MKRFNTEELLLIAMVLLLAVMSVCLLALDRRIDGVERYMKAKRTTSVSFHVVSPPKEYNEPETVGQIAESVVEARACKTKKFEKIISDLRGSFTTAVNKAWENALDALPDEDFEEHFKMPMEAAELAFNDAISALVKALKEIDTNDIRSLKGE